MDLNQLRTFVAVCEEQNVTKAARRLFLTPPSVSAHIKALEEELNVELFERTSKGMQLTQKGQILRQKAEHTLQAAQEMVNYATEMQSHLIGTLVVGLNASPRFLRVGMLAQRLRENAPGIELTFTSSTSGRIIEDLRHQSLDAGFIFGPVTDPMLTAQHLGTANLVVAIPNAWEALKHPEQVDWPAMAQWPWIYADNYCPFQEIIDQLFVHRGLNYQRAVLSNDEVTKSELVKSGIGATLLEETEARQAEKNGMLTIWPTEPIPCDLSFAYLGSRGDEPVLKTLITIVTKAWAT